MVGAEGQPSKPGSALLPSRSLAWPCEICFGLSLRVASFRRLLVIPDCLSNKPVESFWGRGMGLLTGGPPHRAVVLKLQWALESPGGLVH